MVDIAWIVGAGVDWKRGSMWDDEAAPAYSEDGEMGRGGGDGVAGGGVGWETRGGGAELDCRGFGGAVHWQ